MIPPDLAKSVQEALVGLFRKGTRFRAEKISILVGFVVVSGITVVWAFNPPAAEGLGADVEQTERLSLEVRVANDSNQDWHDVRFVLDRQHLYTTDVIEAGESVEFSYEELNYIYHVPRSWGQRPFERLADANEKPAVHADADWEPTIWELRAREGYQEGEF